MLKIFKKVSVSTSVVNTMNKLISKDVQLLYSWKGANGKKAFKNANNVIELIHEVLKDNYAEYRKENGIEIIQRALKNNAYISKKVIKKN